MKPYLTVLAALLMSGRLSPPRSSMYTGTPTAAAARTGSSIWKPMGSRCATMWKSTCCRSGAPRRAAAPASRHTGVIGGKFVEGHVPVAAIRELQQRDDLAGVAVPGMPAGSPGMDYGQPHQRYQVIGLTSQAATWRWATISAASHFAERSSPGGRQRAGRPRQAPCLPPSGAGVASGAVTDQTARSLTLSSCRQSLPGQQADRTVMFGSACRQMRRAMVSDRTAATVCPAQPHRT